MILTCQVEDEYIPQLIPLYWICSVLIIFIILLILVDLYYFREKEVRIVKIENLCRENNILFLW